MGETLPANRSAAVQPALPELGAVEADHFSGWTPEDVEAEVDRLVPGLTRAEMMTTQYRRLVGLGLYEILAAQGERAAGEHMARLVASTGASSGSLRRWRSEAQRFFDKPDPSPRSAAQGKRQLRAQWAKSEDASAPIEAASTAVDDPPPPAPARTPTRREPPTAVPQKPSETQRRDRLHAGCPSCTCPIPQKAQESVAACTHPPPLVKRNGRWCLLCGKAWK